MNSAQLPHLLCLPEMALSVGGALVLAPSGTTELAQALGAATPVQVERVLFVYRIPHLPDLLSSPHLAGRGERERLAEALERQARLVANLGKWKGTAVALRYLARPEQGEVEVALVARGIGRAGQGRRLGEELAADLGALLASFELPVEPVLAEDALKAILGPISEPLVLELRQREEVVSMRRGGAYVVYPLRPPTTTWVPFFETLLRQRAPCIVCPRDRRGSRPDGPLRRGGHVPRKIVHRGHGARHHADPALRRERGLARRLLWPGDRSGDCQDGPLRKPRRPAWQLVQQGYVGRSRTHRRAGVMAVMAVAKTARFDIRRQQGRRY